MPERHQPRQPDDLGSRVEFVEGPAAEPGDVLGPLAELLLDLAEGDGQGGAARMDGTTKKGSGSHDDNSPEV
jgi:hypothetical protein